MVDILEKRKKQIVGVYSNSTSLQKGESIPLLDSDVPIKDIISFLEKIPNPNILQKSAHPSGLVQKKVAIKRKDGGTYYAIRWVQPGEKGDSNALSGKHPKYESHVSFPGATDEERIQKIHDSDLAPNEKVRKLASEGIYDKKHLAELSGHKYPADIAAMLRKEVDIDSKSFSDNACDLPSERDPNNPTNISNKADQKMAISEIAEKLGSKKAFEAQKAMKDEILKKYNITVDDKWEGYEDDLNMLLDGSLGLRAVMGFGTGGVGKTYTLESKIFPERKMIEYDPELDMEKGGEEYDYVKIGGKIGSRETQRAMFEHKNKILVFDDCDSMWNDEGLINVLKNALDTSGRGKCQWAQSLPPTSKDAADGVPSSFTFDGRMIFITNLTKQELVEKGAAAIVESRCSSTDLSMNLQQTLERLIKIAPSLTLKDENRNAIEDITLEDKMNAFEAFKEVAHLGRIDQVNTRVLTQIVAKARVQRLKGAKKEDLHNYLIKQVLKQFGY